MKLKYIVLIFVVWACRGQRDERIVRRWVGREIIFPHLEAKIEGRDTICNDLMNKEYKILVYIDSVGCISCKFKLFEWQKYINDMNLISDSVGFIFVVSSVNYKEFEDVQKTNRFYYPVFYDKKVQLDSINNLPDEFWFQVFLLDKTNHVLAIGNPVLNSSIHNLYKKIVKGEL